jgi:hypothetical protein
MLEEVKNNFDRKADHHSTQEYYMRGGALRHGRSVWLSRSFGGKMENTELFPNIDTFLLGFCLSNKTRLGRTYIHRLKPNQHIDKHADVNEPYFFNVARYQIYLNKPLGVRIVHDGPDIPAGQLMYFNLFEDHEYINDSNEDFYLLVFDAEIT